MHNRHMDVASLVVDALTHLAIPTGQDVAEHEVVIEPSGVRLEITYRSLVTDDIAERFSKGVDPDPDTAYLVVADRVTSDARATLTRRGIGYYDLRGHLALRSRGLVIDADVPAVSRGDRVADPLAGRAGLEVAVAVLMAPERGASVRELGRQLDRAPSTVSGILGALREESFVDSRHRVSDSRLFWRVVERWPATRQLLGKLPAQDPSDSEAKALRIGSEHPEATVGWALTDTVAALAYDAPVAVNENPILDFFVPDEATKRRATTLLGVADGPTDARCSVRIAPVRAVCAERVDLGSAAFGWAAAHPLFVALDLAKDVGRGREILDAWTPTPRWSRVW